MLVEHRARKLLYVCRRCDLWQRATCTEPGLPAGTICIQPNGTNNQIFLGDAYQFFYMMKGGTSQNLSSFYLHNSWIYVEIVTQMSTFPYNLCSIDFWACHTQRMYKVTLIVNKDHMVYSHISCYHNCEIKVTKPRPTFGKTNTKNSNSLFGVDVTPLIMIICMKEHRCMVPFCVMDG